MIEDTVKGIMAAKNANMRVIGITTSHDADTLCIADHIVNEFSDVFTWVNKWMKK